MSASRGNIYIYADATHTTVLMQRFSDDIIDDKMRYLHTVASTVHPSDPFPLPMAGFIQATTETRTRRRALKRK